jgi:pantoate--beta-alanine ligase
MTRVWQSVAAWQDHRRNLMNKSVGFVPTMGALHRGHASLVERCRTENEIVVTSIFVNPSQFNDPNDLDRYPRTLDTDLALLRELGTDEVLVPSAIELYPNRNGFRIEPHSGSPVGNEPPPGRSQVMEAVFRPGFFEGVLTIVLKLLNIVRPDRAYFGEKDYQQLQLVTDMVDEFFLATQIIACPTVREESGLAESSRNALLSATAKDRAALLFRALTTAPNSTEARALLEAEGFTVDYVEEHWGRRLAAATLDGVRLIDNVPLETVTSGQRRVTRKCG